MARRRKRSKMPRTTSANSNPPGGAVVLDKSLPALPPHVVSSNTFPPPPDSDGITLAGSLAGSSPSASVVANPLGAQKGTRPGPQRTVCDETDSPWQKTQFFLRARMVVPT